MARVDIPDFPERGKFRTWDQHWNPSGFSDAPQHAGQQAVRFPLDWSPLQCFLAAGMEIVYV